MCVCVGVCGGVSVCTVYCSGVCVSVSVSRLLQCSSTHFCAFSQSNHISQRTLFPHTHTHTHTDPALIGKAFVRQYYTQMHKDPSEMHRFYLEQSSFVHGGSEIGSEEPVIGQKVLTCTNYSDVL